MLHAIFFDEDDYGDDEYGDVDKWQIDIIKKPSNG